MILKKWLYKASTLLIPLLCCFYDKEHLRGKHFDNCLTGFIWAIRSIFQKNILRLGTPMPWPTGLTCHVSSPKNIVFHPDDLNNFQSPGTYFQNFKGTIEIGRGCYIGPNVGIITVNHNLIELDKHEVGKDVFIGDGCWIGMNSVILPGVVLGDNTVVAAGSVVTKSFQQGCVLLAGSPAKVIKSIC